MPAVGMSPDGIRVGPWLWIAFQQTLRVPVSSETYPLPPGLGAFPVRRVEDHLDRLPGAWAGDDAFLPMYQREALWIAFRRPCGVKVGVGTVNAVSGEPWDAVLRGDPQDHVVVPDQPWLDGINTGDGSVRKFVLMLQRMFSDPAASTMKRRLMFSSDCYMVALHPDHDRFLANYRRPYRDRFGDEATAAFLGGTARRFLGFDDAANKNAQRLRVRYQQFAPDRMPTWLAG
jgi:hypothetical protein